MLQKNRFFLIWIVTMFLLEYNETAYQRKDSLDKRNMLVHTKDKDRMIKRNYEGTE